MYLCLFVVFFLEFFCFSNASLCQKGPMKTLRSLRSLMDVRNGNKQKVITYFSF